MLTQGHTATWLKNCDAAWPPCSLSSVLRKCSVRRFLSIWSTTLIHTRPSNAYLIALAPCPGLLCLASSPVSLMSCTFQAYKRKTEAAKKEYLKALAAYRASLVSKVMGSLSGALKRGSKTQGLGMGCLLGLRQKD